MPVPQQKSQATNQPFLQTAATTRQKTFTIMAKRISLIPGLEDITGTISKNVWYDQKGKHVRKTVICKSCSGKRYLRFYDSDANKRRTPVTEGELKRRQIFAWANKKASDIMKYPPERQRYADKFKQDKGLFNGKKYATLRGYITGIYYQLYSENKECIKIIEKE